MPVACVGDNVVDIYASLGEMYPGGNTVNVAVAAHRAGVSAAYVGCTGNDTAGELVRESLLAEGVDIERVRVIKGSNAHCQIELVEGDRIFGNGAPGVSQATPDDGDLEYLRGFDVVHTGDNSGLEPEVRSLAAATAVSYDFGSRPNSYWKPLAAHVRIACFSMAGADQSDTNELARTALACGPELVLVTQGNGGASVFNSSVAIHLPALEVELIDSLGAGDSLIGAFLAGITRGLEPEHALANGIHAAAATCRNFGAFGYGTPAGEWARGQPLQQGALE